MNIAGITGHLTRDPELRRTGDGKAVASFCVAVKRPYSKDKTDFIDCVAWGNIAEFVSKYFSKGSGIAVDGFNTTRTWDDKDGNKRKSTELVASSIGFMGSNRDNGGTHGTSSNNEASTVAANAPAAAPEGDYSMIEDDDAELPF
jgi:single-strand DNA-binding protein